MKIGIQYIKMAPGFRRDDVWTPVSTGVPTFYKIINIGLKAIMVLYYLIQDLPSIPLFHHSSSSYFVFRYSSIPLFHGYQFFYF